MQPEGARRAAIPGHCKCDRLIAKERGIRKNACGVLFPICIVLVVAKYHDLVCVWQLFKPGIEVNGVITQTASGEIPSMDEYVTCRYGKLSMASMCIADQRETDAQCRRSACCK